MSYNDLRDFYPEYATESCDGYRIEIEKLGGGTIGKAYSGTWRYIVTRGRRGLVIGEEITRGQDLETGTPHTHEQAASVLADFLHSDELISETAYLDWTDEDG